MKRTALAVVLVPWLLCCTDEVRIQLKLKTELCTSRTEITRVDLYVLNVVGTSLCTEVIGTSNGSSGEATLPPVQPTGDVVLLALAYGDDVVDSGPTMDRGPEDVERIEGPVKADHGFLDHGFREDGAMMPDAGDTDAGPWSPDFTGVDARSFGLAACIRCYGIERLALKQEAGDRILTLTPASGCKVPASAFDGLGVIAAPLPPQLCH